MQINTSKTKMFLGRPNPSNFPRLSTPTVSIERVTAFKLLGMELSLKQTFLVCPYWHKHRKFERSRMTFHGNMAILLFPRWRLSALTAILDFQNFLNIHIRSSLLSAVASLYKISWNANKPLLSYRRKWCFFQYAVRPPPWI